MSNSQYFPDGRKSGKLPEKSNFAQTCKNLSQFMKEKGNLRDLTLGINGKLEALGKQETSRLTTQPPTMNLLNVIENSGRVSIQTEKSVDLFPCYAGEDTTNEASYSKQATMEPKASQMIILYGGQVLVFDDFPAEKVMEIMLLASKGSSQHSSGFVSTFVADRKIDHGGSTASGSNTQSSNPAQDRLQSQAIGSDMPIARRASLHRFLEKRKDRTTVRAPYQLHNPSAHDQKEQFDLNL